MEPRMSAWRHIIIKNGVGPLVGFCRGHPHHPYPDWLITSEVVEIDREAGYAQTRNTRYELRNEFPANQSLREPCSRLLAKQLIRIARLGGYDLHDPHFDKDFCWLLELLSAPLTERDDAAISEALGKVLAKANKIDPR